MQRITPGETGYPHPNIPDPHAEHAEEKQTKKVKCTAQLAGHPPCKTDPARLCET